MQACFLQAGGPKVPRHITGKQHSDMATWVDPAIPVFDTPHVRGWFYKFKATIWLNHVRVRSLKHFILWETLR